VSVNTSQLNPHNSFPWRLLTCDWLLLGRTLNARALSLESSRVESYVTTDGQSASLSSNKAPIWGLKPDLYYCMTFVGLLMWSALSDERTGLSFTIAPGPSQRSHSRVQVPWDSWPYFAVSDSKLPLSLSPTTRRATVEVFDPSSTPDSISDFCISVWAGFAFTGDRTPWRVLLLYR
jgi:hypothetical protein